MIDYYNLLGVSPEATPAELKRAFRARAKGAHPDAHPGLPPGEAEAVQRRFILLAQAYETLSHPQRRERYHRQWQAGRLRTTGTAHDGGPAREATGAGNGAGGGTGAWRSTRAGFRAGRRGASAPQSEAGGDAQGLEDLLRDVESLLGRFGLELRQPFEELLETLLEWAKGVFRQVAGAWDSAGEAEPSPRPGRPAGSRPRSAPGAGGATDRGASGRGAKDSDRAGRAAGGRAGTRSGAPPDVEAELRALKAKLAGSPPTQGGKAGAPPDVEAELRRLKRKLGKEG